MEFPVYIISLGAGVQSSALALMASCGEITPMPTAAIFADTQDEPDEVHKWLEFLIPKLAFPVFKVTNGSVMDDGLVVRTSKKSGKTYIKSTIPAFTLQPNGKRGLLGRKCTADYKVKAIVSEIKKIVGTDNLKSWKQKHKSAYSALLSWEKESKRIKSQNKNLPKKEKLQLPSIPFQSWKECQDDALAVSWIGISSDEAIRMKESRIPWIKNEWPLAFRGISRDGCISWLSKNGYPEAPRSACKKCPFHSDDEWIKQKENTPEVFEESCAYEEKLQEAARNQTALTGVPYLHELCIPLRSVKFIPSTKSHKQVDLFGNECEGLCGV